MRGCDLMVTTRIEQTSLFTVRAVGSRTGMTSGADEPGLFRDTLPHRPTRNRLAIGARHPFSLRNDGAIVDTGSNRAADGLESELLDARWLARSQSPATRQRADTLSRAGL